MPSTLVNRDPFAREELHRTTVPKAERRCCAWCDNDGRFQYHVESDAGRRSLVADGRPFCSVGCMRAYCS